MNGMNGSALGNNGNNNNREDAADACSLSNQENECLPIENVSIVEDMLTEEKLENLRAMVNGNVRKKLYFNPAYFEPHMLMQPPPAAIEFLQKIREVIAIAKYKMASKRFQPSLIMIPEEGTIRSCTPSIYGSTAPQPSGECQGCVNNRCSGHVKNCGDKRNSIEKWLETVTNNDEGKSMHKMPNKTCAAHALSAIREGSSSSSSRSSPRKDITSPKQRPPPPPVPTAQKQQLQALFDQNNAQAQSVQAEIVHSKFMQKVSIPVNHNNFTAMSAAVNLYGFCGSDIYNNPRFNLHDSPNASQRSRGSSHRSKSPKKRLDVLEQYATASTPTSLNSMDRQHYNMLRNMQKQQLLAEPNYDFNNSLKSNASYHLNIPTPDYDSTIEKKIRDIYNNSSGPSVPTPDYSTLSKKSMRQYQPPDSPIYRRKSPQYLIVDYETDSLERMEATKRKSSHSSSSPSSDVSSQLSPSLSTALPLEEELEISHTVYDKTDAFRRDEHAKNKLPSKAIKHTKEPSEVGNRIKYDTPFRGSMTIEVEHEPQSDLERSTDSDQFEPDTLDRKPKKQSFCDLSAWPGQLKNSPTTMHSLPDMSHEQFESLPPTYTNVTRASFMLRPRSSSFNQDTPPPRPAKPAKPAKSIPDAAQLEDPIRPNFGSLRDLYEAQAQLTRQNSQSSSCRCGNQLKTAHAYDNLTPEQGRLLTLEAKHTRRQKQIEIPPPPPPPVVEITKAPPNKTTIKISTPKVMRSHRHSQEDKYTFTSKNYESSTPNSTKRCTVSKSKFPARSPPPPAPPPPPPPTISASTTLTSQKSQSSIGRNSFPVYINHNGTEEDTISYKSESTEVTRISDTMARSENDASTHNTLEPKILDKLTKKMEDIAETATENEKIYDTNHKLESPISPKKVHTEKDFEAMFNRKINGLRTDYSLTKYMNRKKLNAAENEQDIDEQSVSEAEAQLEANNNNNLKNIEADSNKLEVLSISSISNRSSSRLSDRTKELYRNAGVPVGIAYPQRSSVGSTSSQPPSTNVQTVYRCEIEPVQLTHGMQIAMGLRDRAKKAKDLKNAWKKFVNMAASKFSPTHSPAPPYDKKSTILEALERDEGIASLIDEQPHASGAKSSFCTPAQQNYYEQRFGTRLQELDSGYISADSGELYRRSFYDRYNFKMKNAHDQIIRVDTIEDNSERGSTVNDIYNANSSRRNSVIENERFEDLENIGGPPEHELHSDADSDKTITQAQKRRTNKNAYSSEDGSSETDGETNGEDMWESGAESIETHSVLYKNIRKN